MSFSGSPRAGAALAAALVLLCAGAVLREFRGMAAYSDEGHHLRQIRAFCAGDFALDRKITMLPGYHLVGAGLGRLVGDCSLATLRRVNACLGLLSAAAFYFAARATPTRWPALRMLQYFLMPVILPYHFLVYTDTVSLLLLAAVGLLLRGASVAAGLVICASLLFRQTNVVWLGLVALYVLWVEGPERRPRELARRLWPCFWGSGGFLLCVLLNGGVALGDARAHRAGLHLGNAFFFLLLFAVLFLPRNLVLVWTQRARFLHRWRAWVLGAVALAFLASFGVAHAYNRFPGFLRNDLLMAADEDPFVKLGLLAPVLLGSMSLLVGRLALPAYAVLYPIGLLSLLPVKLIDQRYAFVSLAFYQLLRPDDGELVEALTLGLYVALAAFLVHGVASGAFLV